jgi:hypothetical protein
LTEEDEEETPDYSSYHPNMQDLTAEYDEVTPVYGTYDVNELINSRMEALTPNENLMVNDALTKETSEKVYLLRFS